MKDPLEEKIQADFVKEEEKRPPRSQRRKTKMEKAIIFINILFGLGVLIGLLYPVLNLLR